MTTHIILVPGFWLGAWAWDGIGEALAERGNQVTPLTLPGLGPDDDRATTTLEQQAQAIVAAADNSVLVVHSGGAAAGYLATDMAPNLFTRVIYIDAGPLAHGQAVNPALDPEATEWPLPAWAEFEAEGSSLEGLDHDTLVRFRERAVPEPALVARTPLTLQNPDRRKIPTTIVCTSFPSAIVKQMRDAGHPIGLELLEIEADYIDLPTSHWPMWSKPAELTSIIDEVANR
ncbi:alpha/beta fold hydrolase [Antrihabitans sp. YC2-6]|uniref:alpha/beta fold hydrolase n=1 Tax=Antrihabitans sp. YC2-6 TaxID=2799498 RepID=UPI0018F6BF69|nr:alpha/beta hydrolase [Antrihabitans sp. YC2-6]MBJ8343065.1 alpha/beta hydrolase [Antrihabitans sp. YC2-6]